MKVDKWPLSCVKLYLSAKRFFPEGVRMESGQEMIETHHQREVSSDFFSFRPALKNQCVINALSIT